MSPVILQIVGISLDRVRGPLDISQIRQISLDRLDRDVVDPQDRPPTASPRRGITTRCTSTCSSNVIYVLDEQEITMSRTRSAEQQDDEWTLKTVMLSL